MVGARDKARVPTQAKERFSKLDQRVGGVLQAEIGKVGLVIGKGTREQRVEMKLLGHLN